MKLRIAKSEIHFYINRLVNKGYTEQDCFAQGSSKKIYLRNPKTGDSKIITFTSNGWLKIE